MICRVELVIYMLRYLPVDANSFAEYYGWPSFRGIAQSGSAPALGAGCRGVESLYPDQAPVAQPDRAPAF